MISAKIIADSVNQFGNRLTTLELVYPRLIHAEALTHRRFSRNASSSRAVPVAKLSDIAISEMVEPIRYGKNQAGMQATEENLEGESLESAKLIWRQMAEFCAEGAKQLGELGLHKQWANRPLEWFSNIRVLMSGTEWDNFFELRIHENAQPEFYELAHLIRHTMQNAEPKQLKYSEWHLPYISKEDRKLYPESVLVKISAARCCRVSYLKHDGTTPNIEEDFKLYARLVGQTIPHYSPLEHQATPDVNDAGYAYDMPHLHGNFVGWKQYRKMHELENRMQTKS